MNQTTETTETRQEIVNKLSKKWQAKQKIPKGPPLSEVLDAVSHRFLDYLIFDSPRLMQQYGSIIRLMDGQYLIADPEAFKHILKTHPDNYSKKNMTYERIKLLLGDGLITQEGDSWMHHRQLINPFYERSRFANYAKIMVDTTQTLLNNWQDKTEINIVQEMSFLTLTISFLIYCNHAPTEKELKTLYDLLVKGGPHISYGMFPNAFIPTWGNLRFFNLVHKTNNILQKLINNRRTERKQYSLKTMTEFSIGKNIIKNFTKDTSLKYIEQDLIDLLLSAECISGKALSDSEIRDELRTMLFASHETTTCGLVWCLYLLAKHPHYLELLRNELVTILGDEHPSVENWSKLSFTKAVFLESLRLYPSIWGIPRISLEDDLIQDFYIPKDSDLILSIYALHRNPKYWQEPEAFYPERFLSQEMISHIMNNSSTVNSNIMSSIIGSASEEKRTPFSFLPFSLGPRTCIGSQFAMMEGVILLAMIVKEYHVMLTKPNKNFMPEPYLSLRPPHKMVMKLLKTSANIEIS